MKLIEGRLKALHILLLHENLNRYSPVQYFATTSDVLVELHRNEHGWSKILKCITYMILYADSLTLFLKRSLLGLLYKIKAEFDIQDTINLFQFYIKVFAHKYASLKETIW